MGAPGRAPLRPAGSPRRIRPQPEHVCGQPPFENGPSSRPHPELNPVAGTPPSHQGPRKVADSLVETGVREAAAEPSAPFSQMDDVWSGRRDQIPPRSCDPARPVKQALQEGELVVGEDQGSVSEARLPSVAHWTLEAGTLDRASSTPDSQGFKCGKRDRGLIVGRRVSRARALACIPPPAYLPEVVSHRSILLLHVLNPNPLHHSRRHRDSGLARCWCGGWDDGHDSFDRTVAVGRSISKGPGRVRDTSY